LSLKARLRDNRAVQGGICGKVNGFGVTSTQFRNSETPALILLNYVAFWV
jgi:hypothetical protein